MKKIALTALLLQAMVWPVLSQLKTNEQALARTAADHRQKEIENFQKAVKLAKEKGWELSYKTRNGNIAFLVGVDHFGLPVYYSTENNVVAAATIRTNVLWPGGSSGLNLNGNTDQVKDRMGVWDGGRVHVGHVELTGRVNQKDNPSGLSDHATHVAGTMIASGINPNAKGMAYGIPRISAYDFNNDVSEMFGEAANLLISNHSYGTPAGWRYNEGQSRWEFLGLADDNEDYKFGYYDDRAQLLDSIAYNSPFYLIVKSAGNNRNENGPPVGQNYWRYNATGSMVSSGPRPMGINSNDGYDIISTYGNAKNILTIGAVNGLPFGYNQSQDVILSSFSSFGPTDDGRIKPDVVADGVNVLSPVASGTNSYSAYSGTSMSSPSATGSLLLLQQYHAQLHNGNFMRSATLKGLAIHTADESGDAPGPDYRFGWGLLNVGNAAEVIRSNNNGSHLIEENVLNNGATFTKNIVASGNGPLRVTIAWTDPKGRVEYVNVLNNPEKKLVHDLDVRVTKGAQTFSPWKLNPASPSAAATTGDNNTDNVERIDINNVIPGETYTITVNHKGNLERGSQAYSLIVSGAGGQAYCASAATNTGGARIDNFTMGTINNNNAAGCTTYNDFTNLSTQIEPGQSVPFSVTVGSCDATSAQKIVKIFVDFNNNGSFTDAGEMVAVSNAMTSGVFAGNIEVPATVKAGNISRLRIVVRETSSAGDVTACGNYNNGETQDYLVRYKAATNDLAITELVSPLTGSCFNPSQFVTIRMRNVGLVNKTNVPITVLVKQGNTLITALNATYPGDIGSSEVATYTFQTPFNPNSGESYTFQVFSSDATDKNRSNDTIQTNITFAEIPAAPTAAGVVCGNVALLKVSNPDPASTYFWYTSPTDFNSIATGANANTSNVPANNTFYVGTGVQGSLGAVENTTWGQGGGYVSGNANYIKYNATVPVILESAKLYTKTSGKIDFIVADILSHTGTGFTYSPISTTTIEVYPTSPNPGAGAQPFDPADNGAYFNLNLYLPAGEHAILIRTQGTANIFRNNNVTGSPYPFKLGNLISITGNSAIDDSNPNLFQGFYYGLYDMKVKTIECVSERATVVAPVAPTPSISMVGDSLVSSITNGNQWYRDGIIISGATSHKYKPVQSGTYTTRIVDAMGCQRVSNSFVFIASAVNPVDNASIELSVSPNPNKGNFNLKFKTPHRDDLKIEIVNSLGQTVHAISRSGFVGLFSEELNLQKLGSGIYILKLQHGEKTYYSKIMVE